MSEEKRLIPKGLEEENSFLQPIAGTVIAPPAAEAFLPMVQGAATNRFRATATKNIVRDRNGNAMI